MSNWELLIDEAALATLLPVEHVRFARPVRDALTHFLEGLSTPRQADVLAAQAALPVTATVSQRLGRLAQSCPVLHKLGQILARDRRLAPQLRHELERLESLPPSVSWDDMQRRLSEELGPLDQLGISLFPPALAEASVAVVLPFRSQDSPGVPARDGVLKMLKPGIEERMAEELDLLESVGADLDQRCEELNIPSLDYQESFQQVRDKLAWEVRLDQEQNHLRRAREVYADEPRVLIPEVLDYCTARVTAMERVTGGKISDHQPRAVDQQQRLAALVVEALIAKPVFSASPDAMFHSDPHAGNLFLTDDGRLAILDWSLVGELSERQRVAIVQIMLGALTLNAGRIVKILEQLAERQRVNLPVLSTVVRNWLQRIRYGQFPGLAWLIGMLDDAVQHARLRVASDLMMFRKSLHTLEGVIGQLSPPGFQIDDVLCREFLYHFAVEWPQRWFSLPFSRQFATRLSNLDLTEMMLSAPWTISRYWAGQGYDLRHGAATLTGATTLSSS